MNAATQWSAIADKWVAARHGGQHNTGESISGVKISEGYMPPERPGECGWDLVYLEDGRVFKRPDHYCPSSPWGWSLHEVLDMSETAT